MKLNYCKPKLTVFGTIETLVKTAGENPNQSFFFFNGTLQPIPAEVSYSVFCDSNGCTDGPTP